MHPQYLRCIQRMGYRFKLYSAAHENVPKCSIYMGKIPNFVGKVHPLPSSIHFDGLDMSSTPRK